MRTLTKILLLAVLLAVLVLCLTPNLVFAADPGPSSATCNISVTVNTIIEWAGNFTAISLTAISAQTDTPDSNETQTIYTNANFTIDADQTVAAQLENDGASNDTLITKYKLIYDGNGVSNTGGTDESTWADYNTFLGTPSAVTHVDGDGAVDVTLHVQASTSDVPDAGSYSAIQTLTTAWTSD